MNNFKMPENEGHVHGEGCHHEHGEEKCEDDNCDCEHK